MTQPRTNVPQGLTGLRRERRVVGKAEYTPLGSNPRYVVTSLRNAAWTARALYEDLYCARGEAENRIGEQFELFADRASCETMAGNHLRLMFSAMAYILMEALRRIALKHTQFAAAAVQTIRLKLLKIGALYIPRRPRRQSQRQNRQRPLTGEKSGLATFRF